MSVSDRSEGVRPGELFVGKYRVEAVTAENETGVVLTALHVALDTKVTIRTYVLPTSEDFEAHLRHLRASTRLRGEHFVTAFDVDRLDDHTLYVVWQHVDAVDLATWLKQRAPLPIAEAAELALQTSEALASAHSLGFVHRALSPENLLVTRRADGEMLVMIREFGPPPRRRAASEERGLSKTSSLELSPLYASPEQASGQRNIDHRTDTWAVGVVLYELLSGVTPFPSQSVPELLLKIITTPPAPLASTRADVPPGLWQIIERALAKSPEERFQSAKELVDALAPYTVTPDERLAPAPHFKVPRVDEDIQVSVYRPAVITPQRWHPLLAYVHVGGKRKDDPPGTPDPAQEVERRAREVLGERLRDYRPTTQLGTMGLAEGGQVTLIPHADGLVFDPPARSFFWRERIHDAPFDLMLADPARFPSGSVIRGQLTAYAGVVLLAEVQLSFTVGDVPTKESAVSRASAYRKVFASYSHQDFVIVEQFAAHAEALGDDYLIDVRKLRAGEVWDARLEQFILEADVFQLFWSSTSMHSPFCRREWEYALGLPKQNFVRPVFWEEKMPQDAANGLPPPELKRLQFARLPRKWLPPTFRKKRRPATGMNPLHTEVAASANVERGGNLAGYASAGVPTSKGRSALPLVLIVLAVLIAGFLLALAASPLHW